MDDLAERIARDVLGRPEATADARRAGVLAKANLATEMVGEFPELQGAMGGPWTLPSLWTRRRAHNTMDTPQTACRRCGRADAPTTPWTRRRRPKSERVDDLAERIARDVLGRPEATADARRAGVLAKANLATEMVGEFPELQGAMVEARGRCRRCGRADAPTTPWTRRRRPAHTVHIKERTPQVGEL